MDTFRKQASADAIRAEAAGLRWLAEAQGAPVVELLDEGAGWLKTRRLRSAAPTSEDARRFGRGLAATHAAGADWWGAPPPGCDVGILAELPAPMAQEPEWDSFGAFFAEARPEPYLRMADALDADATRRIGAAVEQIAGGELDAPQPELCVRSGATVARIHGDLWGGNVLWADEGRAAVGTLIDPAAHGGHAESDLAELGVFGAPHLGDILAGYQEVSPLADGWEARVPVHQLHMWLTHVVLFGGSYVGSALEAARAITR